MQIADPVLFGRSKLKSAYKVFGRMNHDVERINTTIKVG